MKMLKRVLLMVLSTVFLLSVQPGGLTLAEENLAAKAALTTPAEAVARGKQFFLSAYLDKPVDPLSVAASETAGGWKVEAMEGEERLVLLLSREGQLLQYESSACPLPSLADGALSLEDVESVAYATDVSIAVDDMFRALIGSGFDAVCCYAAEKESGVYFYRFNEIQAYAAISLEPRLQLLAFGDLRTMDARYGDCLSCREAEAKARAALATAYGLSQGEAEKLALRQFDFTVTADRWAEAQVPTPYWFLVLNEKADFSGGDYTALIDATTGETLEVHDPATSGKG